MQTSWEVPTWGISAGNCAETIRQLPPVRVRAVCAERCKHGSREGGTCDPARDRTYPPLANRACTFQRTRLSPEQEVIVLWFRHSYLRLSPMLGPPRRSASAITAAHWVLLGLRTHAGLATCLGHPAFPAEMRFDVLKASRSSFILLVERVCQRRWLKSHLTFTTLGAEPNVCSHLPLGSKQKPAGLGFRQSSFHHTRLALVTR